MQPLHRATFVTITRDMQKPSTLKNMRAALFKYLNKPLSSVVTACPVNRLSKLSSGCLCGRRLAQPGKRDYLSGIQIIEAGKFTGKIC